MSRKIKARITFYYPCSKWGYKTSTGKTSRHLKTCAVDPKIIPYNSTVEIPYTGWVLSAYDSGPAVVSKKASKGKYPILDVFVSSKAEANRLNAETPDYLEIIIK